MAYIANISILIDVETEAEAMDAIAESMRPLLKMYADNPAHVSFSDWIYNNADPEGTLLQVGPIPEGFIPDNEWPDTI